MTDISTAQKNKKPINIVPVYPSERRVLAHMISKNIRNYKMRFTSKIKSFFKYSEYRYNQ